jgi:AraC-like DNA-binding protein
MARIAVDVGFADRSHMCRVIRQETGSTPAALRHALGLRSGTVVSCQSWDTYGDSLAELAPGFPDA